MMPFVIHELNYEEANFAVRDILFMYRDSIRSYEGFGHNINVGTFAPFTFVDAELLEKPGYALDVELDLLHQGSAVALMCWVSDHWDDTEESTKNTVFGANLIDALDSNRLSHLPLAEKVLSLSFEEHKFRDELPRVYDEYVVGYFRKLINT